ncbi:MAG: CubicO group peptidase (beta-lactamase class C family) [Saprospiraceae bacterium]|jgi:CubicO group peptidase (beta-lactamase class C family)
MYRIFIIVFFLIYCKCLLFAQGNASQLESKLDEIILEGMDSSAFPGAQILIRHKDSIFFHKAWGYHTYDKKSPVLGDDIYDMASVTKVSTGLPLIMKLYGEGSIDIDLPIYQYIPDLKSSNKKEITLRQILAHQARLEPYLIFWQDALKKNGKYRVRSFKSTKSDKYPIRITDDLYLHKRYKKKMKKAIKKTQLNDETAYLYSGLIFLLMPDMISDLLGNSFESSLYDEIYTPIGANSLRYNPLQYFDKSRIVPSEYDSLWRKKLVQGTVHDEAAAMLGGVSCNAGLFGTAEDLSKLFQLYLNGGAWDDQQIINSEALGIFTSYQYVNNRRGLGFDKPMHEFDVAISYVSKYASKESFGHSGFTGTFVWADPAYDLVIVFLSNRVYPTRDNRNLYRMNIRPRFQDAVYEWVMEKESDK